MQYSNSYPKREWLFDNYSKNLQIVFDHVGMTFSQDGINPMDVNPQLYICPLCRRAYDKATIQVVPPKLTFEHVPPESMGGEIKILTCEKCNNTAGSSLDKLLLQSIIDQPFLNGEEGSSIAVSFRFDGKFIRGKLTHRLGPNGEKGFIISPIRKSNRQQSHEIDEYVTSPGDKSGKWIVETISPKAKRRAALKVAYLEMFAMFGNAFLFSANAEKIREAFQNPESTTSIGIVVSESINEHVGLNVINEPSNLKNFLITFALKYERRQENISIIMPGFGNQCWQNYLNYFETKGGTFSLTSYDNYKGVQETLDASLDYYTLLGQPIPRYPQPVEQP